jgi:phospholipase/carboxylesterase
VIWLHGLGADGHDFEPIVPELGLPPDHAVRFVFPHAPRIPVTLNAGLVMRAWYDVMTLGLGAQDERRIRESAGHLTALIAREVERGVPPARIVLAGFSQGGAVALFTGLRHPERLAGILALSTYLLLPETLDAEASPANRDVPILQAHGQWDPMIPIALGRAGHEALAARGYAVEWHEYTMGHQVSAEEVEAIGSWLVRVLALEGAAQGTR